MSFLPASGWAIGAMFSILTSSSSLAISAADSGLATALDSFFDDFPIVNSCENEK